MLIFAEKRALEILRHGRGDKLDGIGLIVGLGGEDQSLATQVFVAAGGDVGLDGLAPIWFVDAKGGVLLGGGVYAAFVKPISAVFFCVVNSLFLCFRKGALVTHLYRSINMFDNLLH